MTAALDARPYQLLPPLDMHQRHLLRESIRANGVLEPVVFDEDGEILDGHHRVEIADELGIDYPRRVIDDLDGPGKYMYALTVNVARRQLDQAARGALVAQLRMRNMSVRRIADTLGVPKTTVARDLAQVSQVGHLPEKVTGADGKDYASSRPAPQPTKTPEPAEAPSTAQAGSGSASPAPEPETCLGADMDCGRPLPCPDHPRTPAERIAAVAEVAPEFVKPVEPEAPKRTLRIVPDADQVLADERRDARALLCRAVDLLAPVNRKPGWVETWVKQLGPYDEELAELVRRGAEAMAVLDDLIEGCGQ